jgi:hypothetical protein
MRPNIRDWKVFSEPPRPDEAMKSGDLHPALREFGFEQLMELRQPVAMRSDGPGIGFGTVLWLLGDYEGAGHAWAQITDAASQGRYSHSSAGTFQCGLLLWFAAVRLDCQDWHDLADRTFDKLLRKKLGKDSWHGGLAQFLQGEIAFDDLHSSIDEPLRERQFPQAVFYAGLRALEEGNSEVALRHWDRLEQPQLSLWEHEYFLALHERDRLRRAT